jgi:predicted amidohydrolase YtcJ
MARRIAGKLSGRSDRVEALPVAIASGSARSIDTALPFGETSTLGQPSVPTDVQSREFDKLILHNADVHTMDDRGTCTPAVGFAAGRVTAVGTLEEVRQNTAGAEERDLGGRPVYPGFIDAHHHLSFAATYANFPEVRTPPYRTVEQILAEISRLAERTRAGEWIVAVGYNEIDLSGHRKPTRFDLDRVAPEHPVLLIHFTYHEGVLNSLGLERSGLLTRPNEGRGGWIERTASGEPNGIVFERCFGHAEQVARGALVARSREGWFRGANDYQNRVLAAGITHVCDAAVPPSMEELYREWHARGELRLGVTMMPLVENMFAPPQGGNQLRSLPDAPRRGPAVRLHDRPASPPAFGRRLVARPPAKGAPRA